MKTETETETEMGRAGRRPGPLRWRALFLAVVLLPAAAWGEQTASEKLKEQLDRRLWKEVGGCPGAERYLKALPEGLHAGDARGCLAAGQVERQVERLLEECEAHFAAGRLSTGRGGSAVDCYGEVLLLDRGNRDALSGLDRVMGEYGRRVRKALEGGRLERARGYLEEMEKLSPESRDVEELEEAVAKAEERLETMRQYAETGREAVGRGDLAKARRYVERLRELDAKSPLAVELEEAIVEAEAERKEREAREAEERRQAQAERERKRKEREAEEQRRAAAEAERKRKAEAEEAARRARAEAERKRKEREAEERRQAEAERERKRKEREAEEQAPGGGGRVLLEEVRAERRGAVLRGVPVEVRGRGPCPAGEAAPCRACGASAGDDVPGLPGVPGDGGGAGGALRDGLDRSRGRAAGTMGGTARCIPVTIARIGSRWGCTR